MNAQLMSNLGLGRLEYVRLHCQRTVSEALNLLSNRTISLARGGQMDVVVPVDGPMGTGNVVYTPGLKAWRKLRGDVITYRFQIPDDSPLGQTYTVRALGAPGFVFVLRTLP